VRHSGSNIFRDKQLTGGGEVVSLTCWPSFIPQEDSWYSFLLEAELIRSIEKSNDVVGNQTCDLPACSMVPQLVTLPLAQGMPKIHIISPSFSM
jgi:hypothetical protein